MQNALEIRRRITAVENTQKITGAMQMVASVRTRSVLNHIEYSRRYYTKLHSAMKEILETSQGINHLYLKHASGPRRTYVLLGADKGMCGAFHKNLLEFFRKERQDHPECEVICIGKIEQKFLQGSGMEPVLYFPGMNKGPSLHRARHIMEYVVERFLSGETDQVHVIFNGFYGKDRGRPCVCRLLPLRMSDYQHVEVETHLQQTIYHPSAQELFDQMVPQYLESELYCLLLQAYASENFMRMTAMQNASRNATELLQGLKVQYHLARQTAITREITEVSSAAEVLLEGGK